MAKIKNITTEAVLNERLSSAIERGVTAPKAYAQAREVIKNNENIEPQLARVLNATLVMYEHVFNVVSDTAPVATDLEALRKKHEELSRYCKKHPGDTTAQSRKEELAIEIGSMVNDSGAVVLSAGVWGKDLTNKRGIRMEEQMVCPLGNDESKGDTSYPRLVEKKEEQWKKYLAAKSLFNMAIFQRASKEKIELLKSACEEAKEAYKTACAACENYGRIVTERQWRELMTNKGRA